MRRPAGSAARSAFTTGFPSSIAGSAARRHSAPGNRRTAQRLLTAGAACTLVLLSGCNQPTDSVQWGYRGNSMIQVYNPANVAALEGINAIPEAEPSDPYDPSFPMASELHQNVQVLTDLNALELARLMNAMTTWIAPEEGCAYCHNTQNLADDSKYTKVVSRQMIKMTRDINANWQSHVKQTGVTCWTCHRGQPVPSDIWFEQEHPPRPSAGISGWKAGQNLAGVANNGFSSLPYDPLTPFLYQDNDIRVQGTEVLPHGNRRSIKQAEYTYALMMYMSESLGVNCTYCHQTRAMGLWEESTPQRVTAWHGIRMVRNLNNEHLSPLLPLYPDTRLGPAGDAPKAACDTCHKGTYKPLYGETMLGDYPSLSGILPGRLSPDPTQGGIVQVAYAPEGAAPASLEQRQQFVEQLAAAAAAAAAEAAAEAEAAAAEQAAVAEAAAGAAPAGNAAGEPETADTEKAVAADDSAAPAAPSEDTASMLAVLGGTDMFATTFAGITVPTGEIPADAELLPKWQGLWRWWQPPEGMTPEEALAMRGPVSPIDATLGVDRAIASVFAGAARPSGEAAAAAPKWQGWRRWLRSQGADADAAADGMTIAEIEQRLVELTDTLEAVRAELQAGRNASVTVATAASTAPAAEPAQSGPAQTQTAATTEAPESAPAPDDELATAATPADDGAEVAATATDDEPPTDAASAPEVADDGMDAETAAVEQDSGAAEAHAEALAAEVDALRAALEAERAEAAARVAAAEHADAIAAAERQISAIEARLDQQTHALSQQLDVVREQRDEAADAIQALVPAHEHYDALDAAERMIRALNARLDQQAHALKQQLAVVREQRDTAEETAAARVPRDEHFDALDAAERQLTAMGARLGQQTKALRQQLEVVRTQRDAAAEAALAQDAAGEQPVAGIPEDEYYDALDAAEEQFIAMGARLRQQTQALHQQLEVVRAQRDTAETALAARIPADAYYDALDAAERDFTAMGARLAQQTQALHQQLEVVRGQRDAAKETLAARVPAEEHYDAIDALEGRVAAIQARLDQNRHALEQQLDVVRSQRDGMAAAAEARIAALEREHAEALEALKTRIAAGDARQEQEREALRQQLEVVRRQRDAAQARADEEIARLNAQLAETQAQLGEARGEVAATEDALAQARDSAAQAQALNETAAALGGEVTEDGIVVNLGGDRLRFASGSVTLPEGDLPALDRAAELLAERPELTVRVEGHTDSVGSRDLNQSLSQQRAEAVMAALVERGVDPARLTAAGVGPDRPIASNATAEGRSRNRRVELYVTAREQVATGAAGEN